MEQSKHLINVLKLVFPPIPLSYVDLFVDMTKSHQLLAESNLYMLCRKKFTRLEITNLNSIDETKRIDIDMYIENKKVSSGYIDLSGYDVNLKIKTFKYKGAIELYNNDNSELEKNELIERFDSENILWQKSINHNNIHGFDNFRDLMRYELLYVGISEKDSYNRLIKQNHHAQAKILRNELPITLERNSGVADEVFIFCFKIESYLLNINANDIKQTFTEKINLIKDAEKVFVQTFQPKYNDVKFKNYFETSNKINELGFQNWGYYIGESVCIFNNDKFMNGNNTKFLEGKEPDCIIVDFDEKNIELFPSYSCQRA